jgi:hypothetical protein
MSFTDRLLLWLHIGFAIFTLGPAAVSMLATPRYVRKRDLAVLRYLYRTTRIYGVLTVGVFLFGLLLGRHDFNKGWFSAAMTLFIVGAVLLVLVVFDQRRAITAIEKAVPVGEARAGVPVLAKAPSAAEGREGRSAAAGSGAAAGTAGAATAGATADREGVSAPAHELAADKPPALTGGRTGDTVPQPAVASAGGTAATAHLASVERGRIATMSGMITAIWLVILVLMVWHR